MAHFEIQDLTFTYPTAGGRPSLTDVSLSIAPGEYVVLCGRSGSGKTTLLRHLKTVLTPQGKRSGRVLFCGKPLGEVTPEEQASRIGYVMQNPDEQIVTDKVWHELAFGLESLGCDQKTMRARVAEMACYFGIQDWFHRDVDSLSGGQKQRLTIARALVEDPEILILDDSASALDFATDAALRKSLNRLDWKVTTFLVSQRSSSIQQADLILVLDNGTLAGKGTHAELLRTCDTYQEIYFSQLPEERDKYASVSADNIMKEVTV